MKANTAISYLVHRVAEPERIDSETRKWSMTEKANILSKVLAHFLLSWNFQTLISLDNVPSNNSSFIGERVLSLHSGKPSLQPEQYDVKETVNDYLAYVSTLLSYFTVDLRGKTGAEEFREIQTDAEKRAMGVLQIDRDLMKISLNDSQELKSKAVSH